MKRLVLLLALLACGAALADTIWANGNVVIGPVKEISCLPDGGLLCWRDAGSIAEVQCNSASATEPGCVTPSAQTFAGTKTFNGDTRIVGHVHASLTACSGGVKGMWQTCTSHNSPVFCDGTNNIELLGVGNYETLAVMPVNRLFTGTNGYLGTFTLPYAATVTQVSGLVGTGAGTTILIRLSDDSANNCDCSVACTTGVISACSGNCSFGAVRILVTPASDGCTTPITIYGPLTISGSK